jgi:hypothetical protein
MIGRVAHTHQGHQAKVITQPEARDGIDPPTHQLSLIERLDPGCLRMQPGRLLHPTQGITQRIRMTGQGLFLPSDGMAMSSIAPLTDLHRCPSQLQQHSWFAEQDLAGPTQGGGFHKREGRQRPEQQLIGHSGSLSLHLQLIQVRKDP